MKNKYRILKILFTVGMLVFLLSFSLERFNNKPLQNINIKLDQSTPVYFLDEKDIREFVIKQNPTNRIGNLDIPTLEKKINQFPSVDSANVYLNLNGNLNLDIKQKVPIFRLNNGKNSFYVDEKGNEFPISKNYSHPCMLVSGDVKRSEYKALVDLIQKIDKDDFSRNFFVGVSKEGKDYNLLTNEGNYKVEIGDLENIDFKVKGFKTFVERYLIFQDENRYAKISVKYNNQIVTTLNSGFKGADSLTTYVKTQNTPALAPVSKTKTATPTAAKPETKTTKPGAKTPVSVKSKETTKTKEVKKIPEKKASQKSNNKK